jgi:hypothetical protein
MISLVNYENIICVVRMLPIRETYVIQVSAVLNGCVMVTGRTRPRTWKAEMANRCGAVVILKFYAYTEHTSGAFQYDVPADDVW